MPTIKSMHSKTKSTASPKARVSLKGPLASKKEEVKNEYNLAIADVEKAKQAPIIGQSPRVMKEDQRNEIDISADLTLNDRLTSDQDDL